MNPIDLPDPETLQKEIDVLLKRVKSIKKVLRIVKEFEAQE